MKKVIGIIVLVLFVLTGFAGCGTPNKKSEEQLREEIKKELQAEMAAEQKKDDAKETDAQQEQNTSKAQKVDIKNMDAIYEFVKKDIKDLVRKDFDLWEVNYLDITGDGTDEAVISGVYGNQYPQKMQIISGDSGELKRIPSDIELYQYENKPELKDGFFVVTGRSEVQEQSPL